jgi:hypothetical protein
MSRWHKHEWDLLPEHAFQKRGRHLATLEGGGKGKSPKAPDYSQLANASVESARIMADLGYSQLDEAKRQADITDKRLTPIIEAQMGLMSQQQRQGDEYFNHLAQNFAPVERSLAKEAMEYDTGAAQERFASQAAADQQNAFANQQGQMNRGLAAMGVNPNSARFMALQDQSNFANAAARAGAQTAARQQADTLGWAKRADVAGLGRGLVGASQGAYGLTMAAGNSAANMAPTAGNQLLSGMAAGNSTIGAGQQMKMGGLSNVAGHQSSGYNAQLSNQNNSSFLGDLGAIAGAGAQLWSMSDRRLKRNIQRLGTHPRGFGIYSFEYIWGGAPQLGVMADEVVQVLPSAVKTVGGYSAVNYGAL